MIEVITIFVKINSFNIDKDLADWLNNFESKGAKVISVMAITPFDTICKYQVVLRKPKK